MKIILENVIEYDEFPLPDGRMIKPIIDPERGRHLSRHGAASSESPA